MGPRPQPFLFNFQPEDESFRLRLQFRKSAVSRIEVVEALRAVADAVENGEDQPADPDEHATGAVA